MTSHTREERSERDWLALLFELADRCDRIALDRFLSTDLRIDEKPDRTLVTEADRDIEEAVREAVRRRSPEMGVYGEEYGAAEGELLLIIDPIDATANFARGIPVFATLLAVEEAGQIVAGLVSAAALGRRWQAARGQGAFCGDRHLRVSGISDLAAAQAFYGSLTGKEGTFLPRGLEAILRRSSRSRGFGDFYQHALVAEGAGELALDPEVSPWDVAALQVIVEEAGGRATTYAGERTIYGGSLVTSNGLLHEEIVALLAND